MQSRRGALSNKSAVTFLTAAWKMPRSQEPPGLIFSLTGAEPMLLPCTLTHLRERAVHVKAAFFGQNVKGSYDSCCLLNTRVLGLGSVLSKL